MESNEILVAHLEIFIRDNGQIHRSIIPLGEVTEEKLKEGIFHNLFFEYPKDCLETMPDNCIRVWPIAYIRKVESTEPKSHI